MSEKPTYEELEQRNQELEIEAAERRKVEAAVHESEERYRIIFEQSMDSVVIVNMENLALIDFNDKACESLGYNREEFKRLKLSDIEHFETTDMIREHTEKVIKEGGQVFETKHRTKNGELRDVRVGTKVTCIGGKKIGHAIWSDIAERKRMERKLRQSEEELRIRGKSS